MWQLGVVDLLKDLNAVSFSRSVLIFIRLTRAPDVSLSNLVSLLGEDSENM